MRSFDRIYIGGNWTSPAADHPMIDVVNPTTEEVIARIPQCDARDAAAAVDAAADAFEGWAATPPAERAAYLRKIAAGLKARLEEMAQTITAEMGCPIGLSRAFQAGAQVAAFENYADLAERFEYEGRIGHSLVVREPVGVVVAITPWNYPLYQIAGKIGPALAAGCTVVLKPSEVAPLNAFLLAEIIHEAGLPPGVFNLVTGTGPTVGEALVGHPRVDMVSLTGSTLSGRRVSAIAAQSVKKVTLELGGKSASVILDDADLAKAVKGTLANCVSNAGQTCTAHTRMLVPAACYEEVKAMIPALVEGFTVGDPMDAATRIGPLVSATQRDRVRGYIRKGLDSDAELIVGGDEAPAGLDRGYYVRPTVFGRVAPDAVIAQEEIFGPVLSIIPYDGEDEAVRIANGTIYGLGGGVWSGDRGHALRIARRLRTGQVDINGAPFNLFAPFGGFHQSGNGRENGAIGLEEFLEYKAIQLDGE
ncbi:aldehyde dehydrogenase family protein [Azospirillum rugosum]|uniref:Acyl-CoA reductase-like NAD-dependent aldehyde dehydrogenase n=1 Tax=Azospirillum rugosum TaxID=416170 RepID=A0ABS4ST59_9PROT|nr:aldehyde dehydrogenase family protein [Azospirillum rugosum]MBP2295757.1 acyl-CoA reductase-like NAD-dependent aldehyde dehydrogenase [Azospirillum rugosum]MDQ0529132.1 acyl-CoA reductase-like NAD-dependent aldehyde dehydrogenase [Azospirillum rugosum]